MIDFTNSTYDDKTKFMEHFPQGEDLTLQLLKGHLLVEEVMRELLMLQLPNPQALSGNKGTSLTCHQVICLVEAITPKSNNVPWVWVASKKLNNIRNDLAHNLKPNGLKPKVLDLVKFVKSKSPQIEKLANKAGFTQQSDLFMVVMVICSCLSSLKAVLNNSNTP